jgi:hypothetical protein
MQSLSNTTTLIRLTLMTAAVVVIGNLAGCGSDAQPMLHATIQVASITQNGGCEDVNVKVVPVTLLPGAPKLSNSKEFLTPVKLAKGADGVSCTGESVTVPMAPGKWKFLVGLPSDTVSCERDITDAGSLVVAIKDGEAGCK